MKLIFLLCCMGLSATALCQQDTVTGVTENRIAAGLEKIAQQHSSSDLYLHLDKTVYDHEENIWFAAYVLKTAAALSEHKTLYVFLQDNRSKTKITSQQFIMNSGYGAGYLFIPDSIPGGNYTLVAYTSTYPKETNPVVFEQGITIRPYAANFTLNYIESRNRYSKDSVYIYFNVRNDRTLYANGATVSYKLNEDGKNISSGKKTVNDYGEVIVGLPLREVVGKKLSLESEVKLGNLAASITTPVMVQVGYARVKYYPEGGDLVNGLPCRLMLEIKDLDHKPLTVEGKLLENGQLVSMVKSDASGIAGVQLTPHAGARYTLELQDSMKIMDDAFPQILGEGLVMRVRQAVIKDSVQIQLFTSKPGTTAYILLHDYRSNYFLGSVRFNSQQGMFTLSAAGIPPGLFTVTIFNENGMPVAERCIYKEPALAPALNIRLDSSAYGNRSKITAHIISTTADGKAIPALVSLACVLGRRIDTLRFQDITSFNYLHAYSGAGLITGRPNAFPLRKQLEQFLLVQGWTRYAWQAMLADSNETNQRFNLVQKGKVLHRGRKLRAPMEVIVYKSDNFTTLQTDSSGNFEVPLEMLAVEADWKINFTVNEANKKGYTIVFENDNDELQKMLATAEPAAAVRTIFPPEEKPERGVLAPVVVKSNTVPEGMMTRSGCDDWVCMNNILNCPNHPTGDKPQAGHVYRMYFSGGLERVLYVGCTLWKSKDPNIIFQLNGRYYTKQFYVADYEKFNPQFPEKNTTLYWNPLIATDEKGEAVISFYTNDLSGRMTLMAQGVTDAGPVSARKDFLVK